MPDEHAVPPPSEAEPPLDGRTEKRYRSAWNAWLAALATDAESAAAAACCYGELPPKDRAAWLDALAEDAPGLDVPDAAVYGPLLAVEADPLLRARILRATKTSLGPLTQIKRALLGTAPGGVKVAVLVIPLYLDFVRVLLCRVVKDCGFDWVRQDPIVRDDDAPTKGAVLDGIRLYACSPQVVVDELAHAVLVHRRSGRPLPRILCECADLFSAQPLAGDLGVG